MQSCFMKSFTYIYTHIHQSTSEEFSHLSTMENIEKGVFEDVSLPFSLFLTSSLFSFIVNLNCFLVAESSKINASLHREKHSVKLKLKEYNAQSIVIYSTLSLSLCLIPSPPHRNFDTSFAHVEKS